MKNSKRLLALLLTMIMLVSLAACGGSGTKDTAANTGNSGGTGGDNAGTSPNAGGGAEPGSPGSGTAGGESSGGGQSGQSSDPNRILNIALSADTGTLHPIGVTGGWMSILYALYEPLWDFRSDGSRRWILATGLDRISDIEYTLHIREGVKFSNGNLLTAEDVLFSFELSRSDPRYELNVKVIDFEKTKVTGDYTIDLWYTEYNVTQEPGFGQQFINNKASYDEVSLVRNPIGTGAYVVDEYIVNSHLTVKARDDYWGGTPAIKTVRYSVIGEQAQVINALEVGAIDLAAVPINDAEYVESLGYNVSTNFAGFPYVAMFSLLPGNPLESKEARWAVCHAIDREAINQILYRGRSKITNYPGSQYMIDFEPRFENMHETYSMGFNPARAKELAEQSGLLGKTIRIITSGASDNDTIAEIIQQNLLDVGINADIVRYEQATYFGALMDASAFEIAIFTPAAPSLLAIDVLAMYLTFIPLGWSGPDRDNYGKLSFDAISTFDAKERGDKIYEALKVFVDYVPWFGLVEGVGARVESPDVAGFDYMMAGNYFPQDLYFK